MDIKRNVSVKPYTKFQIGGMASHFAEVNNWRELIEAVEYAKSAGLPYYIIAGGSNLAFADGTLDLLLIKINENKDLQSAIALKGNIVVADAGTKLWDLVTAAIENNLAGLEKLSGIPGTVGGAVVGNAGAFGAEISNHLQRVRIYDGHEDKWMTKDECKFSYRHSVFKEKNWLVLEAEFSLPPGDRDSLKKVSDEILLKRSKYKWDMKTPGSYFKNLPINTLGPEILNKVDQTKIIEGKLPVGYLLEGVGAKGFRVGGVSVSDFHANVFINNGTATYGDLKTLVEELKARVKDKFGIELEEEVRRVEPLEGK